MTTDTGYTPTTLVVKDAVTFPRERLGEPRPIDPEAFDRWMSAQRRKWQAQALKEAVAALSTPRHTSSYNVEAPYKRMDAIAVLGWLAELAVELENGEER